MRLVIELKRGGPPAKVVLNNLYKKTAMQSTFGANMVALVDGVPRTLSLLELIEYYVEHQREVVTRRTQYELRRAEARAHILEGLLVALDNLDAVIKLIRSSTDPDAARQGLMDQFELSREQSQAILDMRLQRLTALEADKVRAEHADLMERIGELREILGDEARVMGLVKDELAEIVESYGDERRTELAAFEGEVGIEDMIADQQMVISLTASGYVKRLPLATYRQQHRGGVGVMGMNLKDDDYIAHLHISSTHDYLLFFTNRGKVYRTESVRTAGGLAHRERLEPAQPAAAARRREGDGGDPDPGLQREPLPRLRDRRRPGQEDRIPRLQHADPRRRDHRDQGARRATSWSRCASPRAKTTS